jgi:hypothetical protein
MSHYRKIDVRIWNDEKFNGLTDNGKLLFLFLLTHPHMTPLGGMRATLGGLADELKWSKRIVNKHFSALMNAKFVLYDDKNHILIFRNFIKYNQPESPNVIKSWNYHLDLIPEGKLKAQLIQQTTQFINENFSKAFQEALPEAFRKALREPFAKGMPNQEQEQEQEHIINIYRLGENTNNVEETSENIEVIALPTKRGRYSITQDQINYYQNLYPAVNIKFELERMQKWVEENPRKTPDSAGGFICKWLKKTQEEGAEIHQFGGKKHAGNRTATTKQSAFEQAMECGAEWSGSIG